MHLTRRIPTAFSLQRPHAFCVLSVTWPDRGFDKIDVAISMVFRTYHEVLPLVVK